MGCSIEELLLPNRRSENRMQVGRIFEERFKRMVQNGRFTSDEGENDDIREDKIDRAFSTHG
jgi:hypothetical protein